MSRALKIGQGIERDSARWKRLQKKLDLAPVDGWPGNQFLGELEQRFGLVELTPARKPADVPTSSSSPFPKPDSRSMKAFYGSPGDASQLKRLAFPYPMRLYNRDAKAGTIKGHRVHKKCLRSLYLILDDLLKSKGLAWITKQGLDVFGGIYNDRNVRNGNSKSKHAFGAAIDLNPDENLNQQKWQVNKVGKPGWANMPLAAIEIFERHGWKSGARVWGRDAMHFQATR